MFVGLCTMLKFGVRVGERKVTNFKLNEAWGHTIKLAGHNSSAIRLRELHPELVLTFSNNFASRLLVHNT